LVNGVVDTVSPLTGWFVSHLPQIERTLQIGSLLLGLLVGFVSLGNLLKGLGFHLPGYEWLLKHFGHVKNKAKE
jgi:hypothetical protein